MSAPTRQLSNTAKRFWLGCIVLTQLLLPLSASAAMSVAPQGSPFYCGELSRPMLLQLRSLDLPAELLRQLLPVAADSECEACAVASVDGVEPIAEAAVVALHEVVALAANKAISPSLKTYTSQFARAPPR